MDGLSPNFRPLSNGRVDGPQTAVFVRGGLMRITSSVHLEDIIFLKKRKIFLISSFLGDLWRTLISKILICKILICKIVVIVVMEVNSCSPKIQILLCFALLFDKKLHGTWELI